MLVPLPQLAILSLLCITHLDVVRAVGPSFVRKAFANVRQSLASPIDSLQYTLLEFDRRNPDVEGQTATLPPLPTDAETSRSHLLFSVLGPRGGDPEMHVSEPDFYRVLEGILSTTPQESPLRSRRQMFHGLKVVHQKLKQEGYLLHTVNHLQQELNLMRAEAVALTAERRAPSSDVSPSPILEAETGLQDRASRFSSQLSSLVEKLEVEAQTVLLLFRLANTIQHRQRQFGERYDDSLVQRLMDSCHSRKSWILASTPSLNGVVNSAGEPPLREWLEPTIGGQSLTQRIKAVRHQLKDKMGMRYGRDNAAPPPISAAEAQDRWNGE